MANNVDDIIAQAQEAAKNQSQVPATTNSNTALASSTPSRGSPLSLDDLMGSGGLTVDHWLKVNEYGVKIGDDKTDLSPLTVALDLSQVRYKFSIRYGQNPVKYDHTYDHRVSVQGRSWVDAVDMAKKVTPDAREYRSADIPLVTTEDIVKGKDILANKFSTLGLTLNVTGWRKWENFINELKREDVNAQNDIILLELSYEEIKKNGNTWGVPVFKYKETLDQLPS